MGSYELPVEGSPNSTADKRVLAQLKGMNEKLNASNLLQGSGIAEATVADTNLASPNNSAYRTLFSGEQLISQDVTAGTYLIQGSGAGPVASGATIISSINANMPYFYFDDADYAVAGKTQKLRLRAQIAANATKPTLKFTLGLYPITVAGGADELKITLGTVVSGSTVEFNEPAASTVGQTNSGDFTIPADGAYALGVVTSATLTNNSAVLLAAQLQTRSV